MNGPYSFVRPAIGSDGTVYSVDAFAHLYALPPDGGLKMARPWRRDKGVAVGPDNTIYVASENYINAYHPDGSAKWQFVQNPRALICLGVSVGPDREHLLRRNGRSRGVLPHAGGRAALATTQVLRAARCRLRRNRFQSNGGNHSFTSTRTTTFAPLDGTPVFYAYPTGPARDCPGRQCALPTRGLSPNGSLLWTFQSPYPAQCSHDARHSGSERYPLLRTEPEPAFCAQHQRHATLARHPHRLHQRADR